jgi:hypothetical protein
MNQEIQEISIEEIEVVDGGGHDIATPNAAIDYPQVVNNPPG